MKRRTLLLTILLLVLTVGSAAIFFWPDEGADGAAARATAGTDGEGARKEASEMLAPGRQDARVGTPADVAAGPPPALTASVHAGGQPTSDEVLLTLDGRFVDEGGHALGGVQVFAPEWLGGERLAVAGADGRLDARAVLARDVPRLTAGASWPLRLRPEFVTEDRALRGSSLSVARGARVDLGTVELARTGTVSGVVSGLDADGLDVTRVELHAVERRGDVPWHERVGQRLLRGFGGGDPPALDAVGGAVAGDGSFAVRGLPLGPALVPVLVADGLVLGVGEPVVLSSAESRVEVALFAEVVPPQAWIEGAVLLADGRPAEGARVAATYDDPATGVAQAAVEPTEADSQGAFRLRFSGASGAARALVYAGLPGTGMPGAVVEDVALGSRGLRLELGADADFEVRVVDAAGAPVEWANLRLRPDTWTPGWWPPEHLIPAGREGVARLPAPPVPYTLEAFAPGYATLRTAPREPPADGDVVTLTVRPAPAVRGRVTHRGTPVGGALVGLTPAQLPENALALGVHGPFGLEVYAMPRLVPDASDPLEPLRVEVLGSGERHDATTGEDGRFSASVPRPGRYYAVVRAEGFPRTVLGPFAFDGERDVDLALPLERAGALVVSLSARFASSAEELVVGASDGSGVLRVATPTADGTWRLEDLHSGGWQLRALRPPVVDGGALSFRRGPAAAPAEVWQRWDVDVLPNRTIEVVLDPPPRDACVVEGRLELSGSAADQVDTSALVAKLSVLSDYGGYAPLESVRLERDGSFRLTTPHPGPRLLTFEPDVGGTLHHFELSIGVVDVEPGTKRVQPRFELVPVTVRFTAPYERGVSTRLNLLELFVHVGGTQRYSTSVRRPRPDEDTLERTLVVATGKAILGNPLEVDHEDPAATLRSEGSVWTGRIDGPTTIDVD